MRRHAVLALLLVHCGPAEDSSVTASIEILAPRDGDVVCGEPLHVETAIEGVTLVDPYDPPDPLPEGAAHVDLTLNGQDALMSDRPEMDVPDVADGEFQLKVELSKADHTPLLPYAGDFLYVTVSSAACP